MFIDERQMTLIEGVGDEVLDFFIAVGIMLIGWIAWYSTNIADQPLIRTVLILQHRTRTRIAALRANQQALAQAQQQQQNQNQQQQQNQHQQQQQQQQQQLNTENSENDSEQSNSGSSSEIETSCPESPLSATTNQISNEITEAPAATNEEVLLQAMDSYNNDDGTLLQTSDKVETTVTEPAEQSNADLTEAAEHKICIKLKFINDDQKLVTGSLKEMLGEFKRRHFQLELESRKLVRLVFNGQILQPDNTTLEQCGLFNNCVVHCLIHQPRPAPVPQSSLDSSSRLYINPLPFQNMPADAGLGSVQTEWDLSRLLVSVVTVILGLAWYFRYYYAQLFTVTTTVGLFGLTAIFTVSLFGHLFPDQDTIRNIE